MSQFHQVGIIRGYLAIRPKHESAQESKNVMMQADKESVEGVLQLWFEKWERYLNERIFNALTNTSFCTYKKLRRTYHSVKNRV